MLTASAPSSFAPDLLLTLLHLAVMVAELCGRGGVREVISFLG